MRLLAAFVAHEWRTQVRSLRFRAMTIAYAATASAPAVFVSFLQHRVAIVIGPALYAEVVSQIETVFAALLAGTIAVDAITRERDEGSLAVVSLAPMSSTAYVLYRWLAVVATLLPVTLVPRAVAAAVSLQATHAVAPSLAWDWLLHTLPVVLMISAMTLAMGTISGRTVAGLFLSVALLPFLLGFVNDHLARSHRHLDAGAEFLNLSDRQILTLVWTLRGYTLPYIPTEGGYAVRDTVDELAPRGGMLLAWTAIAIALAPSFLRRTRPDLRPWIPREHHPLRTFVRFVNRVRTELAPDAVRERPEWIALALGCVLLVVPPLLLIRRFDRFAALAADRYAAETRSDNVATPLAVMTESVRIDGTIADDGSVRTRTVLLLRNGGPVPATRVSLALNPMLRVVRPTGVRQQWERVDAALVPPLAPGARRQLVFDCEGAPAKVNFAVDLGQRVPFVESYGRFRRAKDAVEMVDFSRSIESHLVTPARLQLSAADLGPIPRYGDWTAERYPAATASSTFTPDTTAAAVPVEVHITTPHGAVVADSCGTLSQQGRIASRCAIAPADYRLIGGPLTATSIGPETTLAYFPKHEELAHIHATSLMTAHALALRAWPDLAIPRRAVFIERPTVPGELYWDNVRLSIGTVGSSGALHALPEQMFLRRKAVDPTAIAAAMILRAIAGQRAVAMNEQSFFRALWTSIALTRVGQDRTSPVVPGVEGRPDTRPLLEDRRYYNSGRLSRVLAEIENRVGTDAMNAGIADFLHGRGTGTARELLQAIGRRGGTDLSRMYTDYFTGEALPRLTLENVAFRRDGDAWRVSGTLRNLDLGESFCPIVIRTEGEAVRTVVHVDARQSVPFDVRSTLRPRTVQLDPDRVCYRWARVGTVDSADNRSAE